MNWRVVLGLALLLAALATGWSAWKHRATRATVEAPQLRPDYVMRDFEVISLDDQGRESMTLKAPLMQRSPVDQTWSIATPLFLLPDPDGKPWALRAQTGWLSAKGEELRLTGGVVGTSPADAPRPTELRTPRLNVFPKRNLARTDARVTITQPGSILSGTSFEANTKTKRYVFKSQVRSRYVPQSAR